MNANQNMETKSSKVLLVDDEEIIHITIDRIFRRTEIQIEHANSATEALERINEGFKVIIADVRMPGMSGIELLQRIKKIDSNIKVILISGYGFVEIEDTEDTVGSAYTCLSKPLERKNLINVVREALT